MIYQIVTNRDY